MAAGLREGDEAAAGGAIFAEGKNVGWAKRLRAHLSTTRKKHGRNMVGTAQLRLCPPYALLKCSLRLFQANSRSAKRS
jgi:hypothetical protein